MLDDAEYLATKMAELQMPLRGVVINRVHRGVPPRGNDGAAAGRARVRRTSIWSRAAVARALGDTDDVARLTENFVDYQLLARGESLRIEQFRAGLARRVPLVLVPNFARDVHDLASLAGLHVHLFGAAAA